MNLGRIVSSDGLDLAPTDWESAFSEEQVPWSHALQAHMGDRIPYLLGPAARITLAGDQLHPEARAALDRIGLADAIRRNPYWSIAARAVELVHAVAAAIDIVDGYSPPDRAAVPCTPGPGTASWATEAPRGLLFHHYELDERGRIATAKIVPPTSQNQAAIEADMASFAPSILDLPHDVATHRLEQLIRSYDPCISCATHFLDLTVEAAP
jgi:coenzyme F420-reducing hydrogenase alpha subunit